MVTTRAMMALLKCAHFRRFFRLPVTLAGVLALRRGVDPSIAELQQAGVILDAGRPWPLLNSSSRLCSRAAQGSAALRPADRLERRAERRRLGLLRSVRHDAGDLEIAIFLDSLVVAVPRGCRAACATSRARLLEVDVAPFDSLDAFSER
jgi:hypothetical protein